MPRRAPSPLLLLHLRLVSGLGLQQRLLLVLLLLLGLLQLTPCI
jgi:hypothetical protein